VNDGNARGRDVLRNYARRGFRNIIVIDLENRRIEHLGSVFRDFDFVIATLRVTDEPELRRRVMHESRESTALMQSVSHDMGTPNSPPIGLSWLLMPFGDTTVLAHSGASAGGVSILAVVPEHDLVFAAFGNDPRAMALHDQILLWLLRQHLDVEVPDLVPGTSPAGTSPAGDLTRYAGTYRSNQLRVDVSAADGQLEEKMTYEPADGTQERIFTAFAGGSVQARPAP
jgi:hypothetical protein